MRSTYHQPAFVGGEISPWAQGRSDLPTYKVSMNVCLNSVAVEEGAWTRRSGTMLIGPTRGRNYAKLLPFIGSPTCAFVMEFTDGSLRFVTQSFFNCTNDARTVSSLTLASPGVVTLDTNSGWADGDDIYFAFTPAYSISLQGTVRNRPFRVGSPSTDTFNLLDDLGADFDTSGFASGSLAGAAVLRVTRRTTPFSGATVLASLRAIQAQTQSVILTKTVPPQVVTITTDATLTSDTVFALDPVDFVDGPYLDPELAAAGVTEPATVSAYTGSIDFTDAGGLVLFTSDDIGRHIRIFTQPADWDAGTTYVYGDLVTGPDGAWWQSLAQAPYDTSNVGIPPGQVPPLSNGVVVNLWAPVPDAGQWAWGKITTITSDHVVVVDLVTDLIPGNGTAVASWQLGLFRPAIINLQTVGYPACGTYHEGRLWLAGAVPNRFDASVSNDIFTFSPSDVNGLVLDSSAIARTLNLPNLNDIFWMRPDSQGIVCGTLSGEVLISASNLNDPLTPTSIQAHQITAYGSANIEALRVGMVISFVQKHQRRLMEYLADSISGRFTGKHLNEQAKHLSSSGIAEIVYQEETVPIVWARMNDGSLAGCTYRRFSRFVTENPTISAWHRHAHGRPGSTVESICVIPGKDGLLDRLFMSVYVPGFGRTVEVLQPFFEVDDTVPEGWFVDQALGPGPGNSGYDCGGGNPVDPAVFPAGGGPTGGDSVPDTGGGGMPDGSGGDGNGADGSGGGTFDGAWWLGVWNEGDQQYEDGLDSSTSAPGTVVLGAWTNFDGFFVSPPGTDASPPMAYSAYGTTTSDGSEITIPAGGRIRGNLSIQITTGNDGMGQPINGTLNIGFLDGSDGVVASSGDVAFTGDPLVIQFPFDVDNTAGHVLHLAYYLTGDHDASFYVPEVIPYQSGNASPWGVYVINYTP